MTLNSGTHIDLLISLLNENPNDRPKIEEIQDHPFFSNIFCLTLIEEKGIT